MAVNTIIGSKYYKYSYDNKLEIVRLEKIKNQDAYVVREASGGKRTLSKSEILEYTKLNPDGYITFAIVGLEHGIQDVIVSLHRKKDINNGDNVPYCTCRQNIFDFFSQQLELDTGITHIGISICKDTCPEEIQYPMVLACNSIIKMVTVNVYKDDTLEDILSYVTVTNYDDVLKKLDSVMDKATVKGSSTSLVGLLSDNHFKNDFFRAFDIYEIPYVESIEDNLTAEQLLHIEGILKHRIVKYAVIAYDNDVDMSKAEADHILVSNGGKKLYILVYIKGEYINREYERLEDKSDRDILLENKNKVGDTNAQPCNQ